MGVFNILIFIVAVVNVFGNAIPDDAIPDDFINVQDQPWLRPASGPQVGIPFEGDMMLTETDIAFMKGKIQGDAILGTRYVWPNAVVPYTISGLNSNAMSAVNAAIAEYNAKTCVKFVRRTNQANYIQFFTGGGCYSYIGKVGGMQKISLGRGCEYKSTAVHEMLHALGFYHEQSRPDRDQYVRIISGNIQSGMEGNFAKHQSSAYGQPYDYDSVMHYGKTAFGGGRQTIQAIGNANRDFGQGVNGGLSVIDAKQVNSHYKCSGGGGGGETTRSPVVPGGCTDDHQFCGVLKAFCSNTWVKATCKKSCGGNSAVDLNGNCPGWARAGYCKGMYQTYMSTNCKKSCNIGGGSCK